MSGKLSHLVWELDLPRPEQWVLLALSDFANDHGQLFCSNEYLAWKTGYSVRQVQRILGRLKDLHALRVTGWHRTPVGARVQAFAIDVTVLPARIPFRGEPDILSGDVEEGEHDISESEHDISSERTGHFEQRTGHPDVTQNGSKERQIGTSVKNASLAPRKRDAIWDVLVEMYGEPTDASKKLRGLNAKVLRNYGADPDEIRTFVAVMAGTDRDWAITTPSALAKHFGERVALMAQVQNPRKRRVSQSAELMRQAMEG